MTTYNLKLTMDELEHLTTTINFYNCEFYHKKMEQAKEFGNQYKYEWYEKKWLESVDLYCKLNKVRKED